MITSKQWREYIDAHNKIQNAARDELLKFYDSLPWETNKRASLAALVNKAIEVANIYGLADATLSAGFYDELMSMYGVDLPPAEIANTVPAFVSEDITQAVAKATSTQAARALVDGVIKGQVKRVGVETMRNNAIRDGVMWAWVCIGDTCAFCRVLGSSGFQYASKNVRDGKHAEHIHGNCDCQFVVKPDGESLEIEGYDPAALAREYDDSDGRSSKDKINAMRRAGYTEEYAAIRNARRRELYADAKEQAANTD